MKRSGKHWLKMTSVFVLGVDSNVLVRYLTRDDSVQSPRSRQLITDRGNQPIHVCIVALVEVAWVLAKVKRRPRPAVLRTCRELLDNADFRVEQPDLVARAIEAATLADCDLADALIGLVNERAGCSTTATFDVEAERLPQMISVEAALA